MAAKKKAVTERYAVRANGEKHLIVGDIGRYWKCGDGSLFLRKANVKVEEVEVPAPEPKKTEKKENTDE